MLDQRRRRGTNIKPALAQQLVVAGYQELYLNKGVFAVASRSLFTLLRLWSQVSKL